MRTPTISPPFHTSRQFRLNKSCSYDYILSQPQPLDKLKLLVYIINDEREILNKLSPIPILLVTLYCTLVKK